MKNAILWQGSTEFSLRNVESVLIELLILGRLVNYGTLTVRGFGGSRDSSTRIQPAAGSSSDIRRRTCS
jgi:hypothetical protein